MGRGRVRTKSQILKVAKTFGNESFTLFAIKDRWLDINGPARLPTTQQLCNFMYALERERTLIREECDVPRSAALGGTYLIASYRNV